MSNPFEPSSSPPVDRNMRPRFDSSRAWSEAAGLVKANREVLLALAGVFFVLPAFALTTFLPAPVQAQGVTLQAFFATLGEYYRGNTAYFIATALFEMIGSLAMLALFTDLRRPTVGEAIREGVRFTPSAIAAQLILGMAVGSMVLLPVLLGGATKSPGFTALSFLLAFGLGAWAMVRLALVLPAMVANRLVNPLQAIIRSWRMTEGNALRLLAFFALLILAFTVVTIVIDSLARIVFTLILGDSAGVLIETLVGSVLQAAMSVYLVAASAAAHGQLGDR